MSHEGHEGHGGMDMDHMCAMNMIWNTQIIDTCIVFPSWHIRSYLSFVLSFVAIVLLGILYEYLRATSRALDRSIAASLAANLVQRATRDGAVGLVDVDDEPSQEEDLLMGVPKPDTMKLTTASGVKLSPAMRTMRAMVYGLTVFLSFFLMLVFMTYNAYLIVAIVLGASIGHYLTSSHMELNTKGYAKELACH